MIKLITTILLVPALSFAQVGEIESGKIELGTNSKNFFIKDGEGYKLNQYKEIFSNQEAIDRIKRARTNKTFASIITYTGSFGIGFGIGMALSKQEDGYGNKVTSNRNTGWAIAGIGAGVMLTSIPLWMGYSNNIKKAVDLENREGDVTTSQLKLNVNADGFGLAYQF